MKSLRTLVGIGAAATAVCIVATAGAASCPNSQTYTDPTGASGPRPDRASFAVSKVDLGKLSFRIAVPNRTALGPTDFVVAFIDSDVNEATGASGIDYVVAFAGFLTMVLKPEGDTFVPVSLPSYSGSYANGEAAFSVDRADI